MSRRYEDVVEFYRGRLATEPEGMHASILVELETALANRSAQEWAERTAYCVCPDCRSLYNEAQYSQLRAAPEGLSRRDEYALTELRECRVCHRTLERALEVYRPRPAPGLRLHTVSGQRTPCANCRGWVEPGQRTAVVTGGGGRGVRLGGLCMSCEVAT